MHVAFAFNCIASYCVSDDGLAFLAPRTGPGRAAPVVVFRLRFETQLCALIAFWSHSGPSGCMDSDNTADVLRRLDSIIAHESNPLKTISEFMEQNPPQLAHSVHKVYAEVVTELWKSIVAGDVPVLSWPKPVPSMFGVCAQRTQSNAEDAEFNLTSEHWQQCMTRSGAEHRGHLERAWGDHVQGS